MRLSKYLFLLLLIPSVVFARGDYYKGATTSVAATPCETMGASGTYLSWWNGDYAADTDKMCVDSGNSVKDGTATGATIDTWANFGISGPTNGGTYGVYFDAANEEIDYAITAGDIVNTSEGTVAFDLYMTAVTAGQTSTLFVIYYGGNDYIRVSAIGDDLYLTHKGNTVIVSHNLNNLISATTWHTVKFAWSVTSNEIAIKVDAGAWEGDADADAVTAFGTAATNVYIGDGSASGQGVALPFYIDNFRISGTYQDASL